MVRIQDFHSCHTGSNPVNRTLKRLADVSLIFFINNKQLCIQKFGIRSMKVLVVVDMQNDFIDGALGTPEAQAIVPKVINKINSYNLVICTQDTHYNSYPCTLEGKSIPKHCINDTKGWELHPDIEDAIEYTGMPVEKNSFGLKWWEDPELLEILDAHQEFEIVGLCTDICVISNALILRAMYPNKVITVDASCCAGTTPEKHKMALEVMKSCQIEVINETRI